MKKMMMMILLMTKRMMMTRRRMLVAGREMCGQMKPALGAVMNSIRLKLKKNSHCTTHAKKVRMRCLSRILTLL